MLMNKTSREKGSTVPDIVWKSRVSVGSILSTEVKMAWQFGQARRRQTVFVRSWGRELETVSLVPQYRQTMTTY